jgi:endoglucanase
MFRMKKVITFLFLMIGFKCFSQSELFPKGSRVCFVGNSITNNGEFYHNIYMYAVTRFPKVPITFFNCGISGDVTGGILQRMDKDILVHNPTHAVIMIGMNDVNRGLYGITSTNNHDTLSKRANALEGYNKNLDSIIRIFLSKNIQVILQKPTIFDQTAKIPVENHLGVNDALKKCADFGETLANKYNLKTVDYWSILQNINTALQLKDSTATIIGPDRVHPGAPGHLIMAYQFLKTMGMPKMVSNIEIDIKKVKGKSTKLTIDNVEYQNIVTSDTQLKFDITEPSLPFPIVAYQSQALNLVPFVSDLNQENIVIKHLKKGNYTFYIDTVLVGIFTNKELEQGINLAMYPSTPQYKQALEVREALTKLWKAEADLRTIQFVEIKFLKGCANPNNLEEVKLYLDDLFVKKLSATKYYKIQFDKYGIVKPLQNELEKTIVSQQEIAYTLAQPKSHLFKIVLKTN